MLAAQGKPIIIKELPRSQRGRSQVKSLAVLTVCLVSLFAFAFAIAASTHGQWQGQIPQSLDSSQYLKLFLQQQQQQEPLVVVDDDDDDDSSGRLAYSPPQLASQQQQQRQTHDTYYATLPLIDEARRVQEQQSLVADQVRREKLAQQLQLARQLLAERLGARQQLAVEVAREQESPLAGRLQPDEAHLSLLERDQLLNRLAAKLRSAGSNDDDADVDDNDDQQQLTSDYSSKPLAAPLVSSQEPGNTQAPVDRLLFGQNANNDQQDAFEEPKSEYLYDLQQEEKRQEPSGAQQLVEEPDKRKASEDTRAGKYTTLLEDEQPGSALKPNETSTTTSTSSPAKASEDQDDDNNDRVATITTTQHQVNETTDKLVPINQNGKDEAKSSSFSSMGSMFGQMLHKITSYLPFLNQMDLLNNPKGVQATRENKTSPTVKQTLKETESSSSKDGADAKQSVSDTATNQVKDVDQQPNDDGPDDKATSKDELTTSKVTISQEENGPNVMMSKDSIGEENNVFSSMGTTFDNVKPGTETNKNNNVDRRAHLENSKRVHIEGNKRIDLDISQQYLSPQQQANVNYMRSSNLVLPIGSSDDELLVHHQTKLPPSDGIISKYIYAPTHHYYLTPNSKLLTPAAFASGQNSNVDSSSSDSASSSSSSGGFPGFFAAEQPRMSHRSFQGQHQQHQFIPGEQIFSSYDSLKPAYAFQKNGLEGIALMNGNTNGNKSNDIYFLVMVGAFCVMAMAVVLAAGLFAYRIQQNRKTSQDLDYPTYGVVGPNNMDGKCGAAAFMGGYLGGGGGPGSSGSFGGGSKSGSAKHLADMYASDSGLASTDKGSSKKASLASASSATTPQDNHPSQGQHQHSHSHSHHQQQPNNRTTTTTASNNLANNQDAARMYHYQHQKQQMIISDRGAAGGRHTSASDLDSEEENEDGSYTVYECPGLASAHEMEIKNPLFNDDQSP